MARIALGITYNGSPWRGWQRQPHRQTVQDEVEAAASQFLASPTTLWAAGRTDAGVHALGQIAHLDTQTVRSTDSWVRAMNSYLPSSIAVQWAQEVAADFHAQFSALSRTYIYVLRNSRIRSPLCQGRVGWVFQPLSLPAMQAAANRLVGEHDFSCFRSSECQATSPVRQLTQARVEQHADHFYFVFSASGFLHHMVRNMVGALVYVGQNKQAPEWIDYLIRQQDRTLSAPTFSPSGLYLADVRYPEHFQIPSSPWRERFASLAGLGLDSA